MLLMFIHTKYKFSSSVAAICLNLIAASLVPPFTLLRLYFGESLLVNL